MGVLKLPGLATGMDTDGLVKTLMSFEQRPLKLMQDKSDKYTTQANAWRDLNQRLLTLQHRMEDVKNLSSSAWNAKRTAISDTTVLSASADATAVPATYTVEVTALATATTWQSGLMASGAISDPNAALNLSGTIQVATGPKAGQTFTLNATDSLNNIVTTINTNKDALGFSATLVQVNPGDYRLVLTGNNGTANDFSLTDQTGTAGASLMITGTTGVKVSTSTNAQLKINGVAVTAADNSVTAAIPGTTLKLFKTGTSTVTVSDDRSQVSGAVKALVDQYNSVMDFINNQTSYDSKTKQAGTLLGDDRVNTIKQMLTNRVIDPLYSNPDGFRTLSAVGVSTEGFKDGQISEKLVFDQTKFEAQMAANPSAIKDLFTTNTTDAQGRPVQGVAVRAVAWLDNYTKTGGILLGVAGALDKNVADLKDRIKNFQEQILPMKEQQLRNQFNNLEKVMASLQNQQKWMASQISSLGSAGGGQ